MCGINSVGAQGCGCRFTLCQASLKMGLLLYKTEIVCRVMLLTVDKGTEIQIEKKYLLEFAGGCLIQVLEFHYIRFIKTYLSDYFNALTFESHYSNMWTKEFVSWTNDSVCRFEWIQICTSMWYVMRAIQNEVWFLSCRRCCQKLINFFNDIQMESSSGIRS